MTSSVLSRQIARARTSFQPLFTTLELLQNCNLACKHCYNFDRSKPQEVIKTKTPLSTKEIFKILEELSELGALSLNLSGGEPLLHPDLLDIVKKAKEHSFQVRLKTNATLLTNERAKNLAQAGVKEIDVSLYGKDEETYIKFCGKQGLEKLTKGIKAAKAQNITVYMNIILHRNNVDQIDEMIALAQELDTPFNISDEVTDRYDGTNAREKLALSSEQYEKLLTGKHAAFFSHENPEKSLMCGCAKTVCGIGAYGDVFPCIGSPVPSGNIREKSLVEIWKKSPTLKRIREYKQEDFKECTSCPLIESCSRSSGSAYINTGNFTACDPIALNHARVREKVKKNKN
jgi:radical SAM protein with 4Fe4S-binding SPASM domain